MQTITHKIQIEVTESSVLLYKAVQYSIRYQTGSVYTLPFIHNNKLKGYQAYHNPNTAYNEDELKLILLQAITEQSPSGFVKTYPLPYKLFQEDEIEGLLSHLITNNTNTDLSKNLSL